MALSRPEEPSSDSIEFVDRSCVAHHRCAAAEAVGTADHSRRQAAVRVTATTRVPLMAVSDQRVARRTIGAVAVAASLVAWWPAFTLGAWGGVFFEQILTLWAAATAAFVIVLFKGGTRRMPRGVVATLLLPSLWIGLSFLPVPDDTLLSDLLTVFGVGITVIGLPFMVWVILQVSRPDVTEGVERRTWAVAALAVLTVAALSFSLGLLHPYFLTCSDFKISGNDVPANCTPGEASLG